VLRPLENVLADALAVFIGLTGSAGWAVILITVLVRAILHPLTRFSLKSMKKMQALAPQVEVLRRKYKENQQQMNVEIMNLYRSSGANPFGGCLPMLIQLPLLYAFYAVLRRPEIFQGQAFFGIPLAEAPCVGVRFIPDAACLARLVANPLLALIVILVGVTMYLQQRMSVTDPQQARMFVFMPILFTVFSLSFPAGLSLYWIVTTVLYIGEYYWVVGPTPRPVPAVARQRAAKPRPQSGKDE